MKFKNKKPDLDGFWAAIISFGVIAGGFFLFCLIGWLARQIPIIGYFFCFGDNLRMYFLSGFMAIFVLSVMIGAIMIICKGVMELWDKRRKK